ncbi:MAG: hypothetical protein HRT36_04045 [Alphaproteobacteria bacterium]|nr:hypothetical protein [Alphaproteobacteria bacterium]
MKTPTSSNGSAKVTGAAIIDWSVPLAIFMVVPVMIAAGFALERGLIQHFYKRPHADQILVTFRFGDCVARDCQILLWCKSHTHPRAGHVPRLVRFWGAVWF